MHALGLAALLTAGHWGTCLLAINRLHALGLPHRVLKAIDAVWYALLLLGPILFLAAASDRLAPHTFLVGLIHGYGWLVTGVAAVGLASWLLDRLGASRSRLAVSNHTRTFHVSRHLGRPPACSHHARWFRRLPGNQIFQLSIHEKTLELDELPEALRDISIAHLSDLHLTGYVGREFYDAVVEQANRLEADVAVLTGDVIDKPECLDWIEPVLGKLKAPSGKYFVLGNHDLRIGDERAVRGALQAAGFVDLGGQWELTQLRGWPVALAGNELPWFSPAAAAWEIPYEVEGKRTLRIALAHSPDQIEWAQIHSFDLMLAGHTHGGQIRLPLVGAVFCPSRFGVRYAAGTFYCPPTVMHVSRGISGVRAVRYGCPPELSKLRLKPKPR